MIVHDVNNSQKVVISVDCSLSIRKKFHLVLVYCLALVFGRSSGLHIHLALDLLPKFIYIVVKVGIV